MSRRLLALVVVAVMAATACGDSEDPPAEPEGDSQEAPAEDDGGGALAVTATDFAFDPTALEVEPGSDVSVDVTNGGSVAHSFTVRDVDVDVTIEPGGSGVAAFVAPDEDATLEFLCRFHPSEMTGTITVGAGGGGAGSGGGSGGGGAEDSEDFDY